MFLFSILPVFASRILKLIRYINFQQHYVLLMNLYFYYYKISLSLVVFFALLCLKFIQLLCIRQCSYNVPIFLVSNFIFDVAFFLFLLFYFIYLLFLAALGLCCCMPAFLWLQRVGATLHCGSRASHCGGFSCCRVWALGARASVVVACGLSSCGSWALERRLSSCGTGAQLLRTMRDLPGPGIKPVSPALAGGYSTTAPSGKP